MTLLCTKLYLIEFINCPNGYDVKKNISIFDNKKKKNCAISKKKS